MPDTNKHEKTTVAQMIRIYCRGVHGTRKGLCPQCKALQEYAHQRIDRCPFGAAKPICAACEIHCYKKDMREQIREVMRYAGPRMPLHHPLAAIRHLRRSRRR